MIRTHANAVYGDCAWCGEPFALPRRCGNPPHFCSGECRRRARHHDAIMQYAAVRRARAVEVRP